MTKAFQVVRDFEAALCEYSGAPYAVTTNSCTMALLLAVAWHLRGREHWPVPKDSAYYVQCEQEGRLRVEIPKRTYVSVPMSIIHAGGRPTFRDEQWEGAYPLTPLPVWDSARWLTGGLYSLLPNFIDGTRMICVSFHASKTLGDSQGGAILHDNPEADAWLRRARFDGRTEGVPPRGEIFTQIGWHCYMSPDVAARLLHKLGSLPKHNDPLPNDDYPDLSKMGIFK
jgi:dTDP-4-amino-4,6-dideoxygalactose transaminase